MMSNLNLLEPVLRKCLSYVEAFIYNFLISVTYNYGNFTFYMHYLHRGNMYRGDLMLSYQ
jgi:hypothetical protein